MAIRFAKIASMGDEEAPANDLRIQPSEVNPFTEPIAPLDNDMWFDMQGVPEVAGSSFTWKVFKSGAWRTVFSVAW